MKGLYQDKKLLLVDDNPAFVDLISILLQEIGLESVLVAGNFSEGVQRFQEDQPDICLLDITLGSNQRTGIDLAEKIRVRAPHIPIIFITSNYTEEYYDRCRHVRPSCFMNKELSLFKLRQAIDLALLNKREFPAVETIKEEIIPPLVSSDNYFFKIGDTLKKISVSKIAYFFAKNKFTYARVDDRNLPTSVQLKTLTNELPSNFHRIHKTYLVNVDHIEQIKIKDESVVINGESIPIGYTFKKGFLNKVKILK